MDAHKRPGKSQRTTKKAGKKGTAIKKTGNESRKESNSNTMNLDALNGIDRSQLNLPEIAEDARNESQMLEEDVDGNKKSTGKSALGKQKKPDQKPNNMKLTNFFTVAPLKVTGNANNGTNLDIPKNPNKMEEEDVSYCVNVTNNLDVIPTEKIVVINPDSLFKRCLGSLQLNNEWDSERKELWDSNTRFIMDYGKPVED